MAGLHGKEIRTLNFFRNLFLDSNTPNFRQIVQSDITWISTIQLQFQEIGCFVAKV